MSRRRTARVGIRTLGDYLDFRRFAALVVCGAVIAPLAAYVKWPEAVECSIAFLAGIVTYVLLGRRKRR